MTGRALTSAGLKRAGPLANWLKTGQAQLITGRATVYKPVQGSNTYTQNYGDRKRRPWRRNDRCMAHID